MAATTITAAQAELINSLSQEEIPIKLRCAICSRLAINAFRLPCCDQAICEACQSSLPSTCPVCEHTPVAAEDCKPNKSLRTTIKVFLRTEEKKREAIRLKEEKNTPPVTPIVEAPPAEPVVPVVELSNAPETDTTVPEIKDETDVPKVETSEVALVDTLAPEGTVQAEQDIPQPSIEEIAPGQESTNGPDTNGDGETTEEKPDDTTENDTDGQVSVPQMPGFAGANFDPSAAAGAGFPGMGFGGDFNQMQMMMAMQNGMGSAGGFGNFPPMMGMPGMSMDPMAMQQMFMNGGFGAGMNGMNGMNGMGMGMGMGYDSGVGAGFNNGWNSQQSWNVGSNINPNAASMGHGDYGSNNSGYASHSTGFNQGNYGRGNHYNDYQNNHGSQGFRGRGRGRGGYGRGGYQSYGPNEAFSQQAPQQYVANQQPNGPMSDSASNTNGAKGEPEPASNVDEYGRELRPETKDDATPKEAEDASLQPDQVMPDGNQQDDETADVPSVVPESAQDDNTPMPIQTLDDITSAQNVDNYDPGYYGQGHFRGGHGSSFSAMQPPVKPVDVPINAPTGPKAMREGLPNTSIHNMRGRGYIPGGASSRPSGSTSASVVPDMSEKGDGERGYSRSLSREPQKERSRSRSRSPNRKRSRSRDRHSRRHGKRSPSMSEDEKEVERRRERRREKERERRARHEEEQVVDDGLGEKVEGRDDVPAQRSRSASPSDSRRSGHKSRRDKEKDKYRERDRDSDRDRDRKSSHRHRSHRHREDRERSRSRDRHEHRPRHSRRQSEEPHPEPTPTHVAETLPTPTDPEPRKDDVYRKNSVIEIKGASSRRKETLDEIKIPTGPRSDRQPSSATAREFKDKRNHRDERSSRHESSRSSRDKDKDRSRGNGRDRDRDQDKENGRSNAITPAKDPHELEREARNRERLLKEAQRIAGLTSGGGSGRKRDRDDGEEVAGGKGRRKKGRRHGSGVMDENEESRLARLEAERESARWG